MARPRKPVSELKRKHKDRLEERLRELRLPPGPLGEPPAWFGPVALEEWNRLTVELASILSPAHRSGLIALCGLTEREVADLMGTGKISASEGQRLHSLRMQFAVMPASQSRVKAAEKQKSVSPWVDTKPIHMLKQA